ncbi:hypothetical protein Tco_0019827 [Tanacetum coccineum]
MLATGRYTQWRSCFLRYINTRPNGDALRKCILEGPYTPSTVIIPVVPATDNSPAVLERITVETILNMSLENKAHFESKKEAIHLILTRIGDEIYSTVDACKTAHEIKLTSHNGETIESYYSRFYKLMNEMIRNNLVVATMQVNVQFLQQLQPEWSRRKLMKSSHKSYAPTSKASLPTRSHATKRHKGKEIAKPIIPPSESASDKDSVHVQDKKDKEMQKNLALIAKQFGKQRTTTIDGARETVGGQVQYDARYNVFANEIQHSEQPESTKCDDERVALTNLIVNLKLDVDENNKIQKQLKKENTTLAHKLTECKSILAETSKTLGESNSIRDSCLVALQNKQTEFERYKNLNGRTVDYEKHEHKLNETLGLLAQKDIDIKEGLKLRAYKISVVKEKHDELVKQSLLTKSHYEGLVKEKTQIITDLKLIEEKDIDKMISMEKQLKFLNEIIPHDQSDPVNRLILDREETLTLERESRSKLNKDLVKPYDYTNLNSFYEIFKPPTQEYLFQLAHANEVRKKMWRKSFVKTKPNIFKNIEILPVSKLISKSRQAYNVMTNNINHLRELVDQAWVKHSKDHFRAPTPHDMEILIKTYLMPLALKTQNDSFAFVHELKQKMHVDLKYVESLEKEIDELESDKAELSNMYDMLLQECVSNDVMCSYLHSLSNLDAHTKLQCVYLHKVKECDYLAQKLSKQTEYVSKEV